MATVSETTPKQKTAASSETGHKGFLFEDKPGRLIVRNLQYDIKQKHLKKDFAKFGEIVDVNVPLKNDNDLNKGFGFIQFKTKEEGTKAIEGMNAKTYKGRIIAVDFAKSKKQYQKKIDEMAEKNPLKTKKVKKVPKEDEAKAEDSDADSWVGGEDIVNKKNKKSNPEKEDKNDKKEEMTKKDKKRTQKNRKKYENDVKEGLTLFVRNIDYTTTESDLREWFEQHGDVYFVRLVKSRVNPTSHKGSAFVKFKSQEVVDRLSKLSSDYWDQDKHSTSKERLSDLESQLEFRNRRLVMFKAESKDERQKKNEESKVKVDKRNLNDVKVGLVGTHDFIHGPVGEEDMETRIRLYKEKQQALKKNPNLFVSKTRMCIRNLHKKMDEKALAEFCAGFRDDWKETLTPEALKKANKVKLIHQFKVLSDKTKTDAEGNSKMSGMGFIEVAEPDLALYIINHMNNFVMNPKNPKGLIIDFSLEDHRKLLKRKQKMESLKKKQQEAKAEEEKENGAEKKRTRKEKKKDEQTIDQIEDLDLLRKLMKETNSRGKRKRIKKRIERLTNGESAEATPEPQAKKSASKPSKTAPAAEEAGENDSPMASEEGGADGVQLSSTTLSLLNAQKKQKSQDEIIEDDIKKQVKNKKRKKKQKRKADEEVDDVMKSFEERINKRLKTIEDAGEEVVPKKSEKGFKDVEIKED